MSAADDDSDTIFIKPNNLKFTEGGEMSTDVCVHCGWERQHHGANRKQKPTPTATGSYPCFLFEWVHTKKV